MPYYLANTVVAPDIGIQPLYPIDITREFAFSNVRHEDRLNRAWHLFTNPLIFVSQTYILDLTPSLFGLSINLPIFGEFKFNCGGFYISYLCIYAFTLDTLSGLVHLVYMLFLYSLIPRYAKYVNRLVGPKYATRTAFILYLFGQFSQIWYGHEHRENFYDWNLYQLFHIQQLITVFNIMGVFGIFPYPGQLVYWEGKMAECMGTINFKDCV